MRFGSSSIATCPAASRALSSSFSLSTPENVSRRERTEPAETRGGGAALLSADNASSLGTENIERIESVRLLIGARPFSRGR